MPYAPCITWQSQAEKGRLLAESCDINGNLVNFQGKFGGIKQWGTILPSKNLEWLFNTYDFCAVFLVSLDVLELNQVISLILFGAKGVEPAIWKPTDLGELFLCSLEIFFEVHRLIFLKIWWDTAKRHGELNGIPPCETNILPLKNQWLEDEISFWDGLKMLISGSVNSEDYCWFWNRHWMGFKRWCIIEFAGTVFVHEVNLPPPKKNSDFLINNWWTFTNFQTLGVNTHQNLKKNTLVRFQHQNV